MDSLTKEIAENIYLLKEAQEKEDLRMVHYVLMILKRFNKCFLFSFMNLMGKHGKF